MQAVLENYPEIVAIVVLVAGLVLARFVRKWVGALLASLDERFARLTVSGVGIVTPVLVKSMQLVAFWLVVAIAVVFALSLLDIAQISSAVDGLFAFLGRILIGLMIVAVGHFIGVLSREAIERFAEPSGAYDFLARFVYGVILLVAVVMGLAQLNIDTSFITQLLLLVIAIVLGGLALAFALGARSQVENILAQQELRRYTVGERIVIGDVEGTIVAFNATSVDVETSRGVVAIPAMRFAQCDVLKITTAEIS
jgi:small-conductance mechanosensitive channel